jgi:mannose-6-phosphate isomerase-like protein (cupin superfamily)
MLFFSAATKAGSYQRSLTSACSVSRGVFLLVYFCLARMCERRATGARLQNTPSGGGNMRNHGIVVLAAMTLWSGVAFGQAAPGGAPAAPPAPVGKAGYFANADLQSIWKDLEARQVLNKRVLEGGSHSINIRIVRPTDAPLVHANSLDIWLVTAGSATAVTGGQLVDMKKRPNGDDSAGSSIKDGNEQPLKVGDVLYVPPGVPHGFKDIQGFRAFLIRFDTK